MQRSEDRCQAWPVLDYAQWRETLATFHLWTQIVGKTRLALSPWLNHGWQVPLYVDAHGLSTSPIHLEGELLEIAFDLVEHRMVLRSSCAPDRGFALEPMTVARFHERFTDELRALGIHVTIDVTPNEVPDPIRFVDDEVHTAYDARAVHAFWRALVQVDRVFRLFRTGFIGKASPVHFFWGSFDHAVTRFSGRTAPLHPGGVPGLPDDVTREAYSHEVSSAGFWPGSDSFPAAAFYSYAYPTPAGFAEYPVEPDEARWVEALGEWVLPYEAVRTSADPDSTLLRFLQTSYRAAADLAQWDPKLECELGAPRRPRALPGDGVPHGR